MKYLALIALLFLVGCMPWNSEGVSKPGDATWRGIIKTAPDSDGVVCYKAETFDGLAISCVKVK